MARNPSTSASRSGTSASAARALLAVEQADEVGVGQAGVLRRDAEAAGRRVDSRGWADAALVDSVDEYEVAAGIEAQAAAAQSGSPGEGPK